MIQNTKNKTVARGGSSSFTLNVSIGSGQPGASTVYRNGREIHSQAGNFDLPFQDIVAGDHLQVLTTISDLPSNPNRITAKHNIYPVNVTADYDDQVSEGDVAINTSNFFFY